MDDLDSILSMGPSSPTPSIAAAKTLSERFRLIRAAYAAHQKRVDAGRDSWGISGDPYSVADWVSIFTPIESQAWGDIRHLAIPLWPQLPVGKFFVDFGNPVARVALECDGAQWHQDAAKDARRDGELATLGWTVFRAPGWKCGVDFDRPEDWADMAQLERDAWSMEMQERSLRPILHQIRDICEMHGLMGRRA